MGWFHRGWWNKNSSNPDKCYSYFLDNRARKNYFWEKKHGERFWIWKKLFQKMCVFSEFFNGKFGHNFNFNLLIYYYWLCWFILFNIICISTTTYWNRRPIFISISRPKKKEQNAPANLKIFGIFSSSLWID